MRKVRKFNTLSTKNDKISWEWLGGFFDGEGWAGFVRATTYMYYRKRKDGSRKIVPYKALPRLQVSISQKEKYILNKINKFLGYGYVRKKGNLWYCNSAKARKFLNDVFPYLNTLHKKTQVSRVLKLDKATIIPRGEKL